MALIVQKYGGTSVGTIERIEAGAGCGDGIFEAGTILVSMCALDLVATVDQGLCDCEAYPAACAGDEAHFFLTHAKNPLSLVAMPRASRLMYSRLASWVV